MSSLTKNVKFIALSVVSIGTLYLGYMQFRKFQRRLNRLERDIRVIQSNIEAQKRASTTPSSLPSTTPSKVVTFKPPTVEGTPTPVEKNLSLNDIAIEDADIDTLNNEGLDRLEQLLENYETDEDSYESETVTDDETEVEETLPSTTTTTTVDLPTTTTTATVDVEEPMKELHTLNQYIHLNDEELHTHFSKNTCAELRELLKKCGLTSGGKKEKLIQRLISHKKSISSISSNE